MRLEEIMHEIEEGKTNFKPTIASTANVFVRVLERDEVVQSIVKQVSEDDDLWEVLRWRLGDIVTEEVDTQYANPNDNAVAIYTYVLWAADLSTCGAQTLRYIEHLNGYNNLFWGSRVASYLLKERAGVA